MSGKSTVIKEIKLSSAEKGTISVSVLEEPYGESSATVASIGVSLSGDNQNPDWKVHVPKDNIDEICAALQDAKSKL